ncbi:related to myosin regulatory light chain 1 [Cephalotrichum gorgonifer]|uniref:Related to myosin regulatory light chain 1 n=1 Tax=Cephalotrichum gorgonifer TaxID=2041049 RepID=A0AAE8MVK6_9PEZI|nr:related to myosin regulatory light chain 1 [Cephalotrichum gorgonifer]
MRHTTPLSSPIKFNNHPDSSSRLMSDSTTTTTSNTPTPSASWTPKARQAPDASHKPAYPASPTRTAPLSNTMASHGNALSQLQPSQVRNLRDGFQILDRDSDGVVNREDVADMLNQLGLPSAPSDVAQFFPPSAPQTMTMPYFLNSLSTTLAAMSPSPELLSALSAFDDDDSGQIDVAELRDALLNTAPEPGERPLTEAEVDMVMSGFTSRRAFNRNGRGARNDVFKYQDFVGSVMGSNAGGGEAGDGAKE